jgi:hypothetical protein
MAGIEPITLPVNLEITESGKALIRGQVAEVLLNDLQKGEGSDIRAFIRTEVRKALAEIVLDIRKGVHHE